MDEGSWSNPEEPFFFTGNSVEFPQVQKLRNDIFIELLEDVKRLTIKELRKFVKV